MPRSPYDITPQDVETLIVINPAECPPTPPYLKLCKDIHKPSSQALRQIMLSGISTQKEIVYERMKSAGFAISTTNRAKGILGIEKVEFRGKVYWLYFLYDEVERWVENKLSKGKEIRSRKLYSMALKEKGWIPEVVSRMMRFSNKNFSLRRNSQNELVLYDRRWYKIPISLFDNWYTRI